MWRLRSQSDYIRVMSDYEGSGARIIWPLWRGGRLLDTPRRGGQTVSSCVDAAMSQPRPNVDVAQYWHIALALLAIRALHGAPRCEPSVRISAAGHLAFHQRLDYIAQELPDCPKEYISTQLKKFESLRFNHTPKALIIVSPHLGNLILYLSL